MTAKDSALFRDIPFDNVLKCVHCGLCLNDCPTYRALGTEQDSPRGRLYLMRGLWEGELALDPSVVEPLARCLDCRACESACPSAVPYGELLEKTRGVIRQHARLGPLQRLVRGLLLNRVLTGSRGLAMVSFGGRVYRGLGLAGLVKFLGRGLLPGVLRQAHDVMPNFTGYSFKRRWRHRELGPLAGGHARYRVGLFSGCVMDVAESGIHKATIRLLRAAGCQVEIPAGQRCCGALHVHAGERRAARRLALTNARVFGQDLDAVIVNAAGCGAQIKEYHHLFYDGSPETQPDWHALAQRTIDLLVFLSKIGFPDTVSWKTDAVTVLYDAPCHLRHAQQKAREPLAALEALPGVRVVLPEESDTCCGAAGIYNLVQRDLAGKVLERKLDDIDASLADHPEARVLLTGNPGCLFQLRFGVLKRGLPLTVMHPAVFMASRLLVNEDAGL